MHPRSMKQIAKCVVTIDSIIIFLKNLAI